MQMLVRAESHVLGKGHERLFQAISGPSIHHTCGALMLLHNFGGRSRASSGLTSNTRQYMLPGALCDADVVQENKEDQGAAEAWNEGWGGVLISLLLERVTARAVSI